MTWRIECGDCLELLKALPDGSVDAVVTDPPYNVGLKYRSTGDSRSDYAEWCSEWFGQLRRVCCGTIAVTTGQSNLSMWASEYPPDWWMAWWKPAAMGRCAVGFNNWEPIAIYGKTTSASCDVIRACIKPSEDVGDHPCPKPIEWATKQVECFSKKNATIIDPFAGSGTTGVACVQTGRNFIGFEIDPHYCEIARKRIGEAESKSREIIYAQ